MKKYFYNYLPISLFLNFENLSYFYQSHKDNDTCIFKISLNESVNDLDKRIYKIINLDKKFNSLYMESGSGTFTLQKTKMLTVYFVRVSRLNAEAK
jgi:hypothetical protein